MAAMLRSMELDFKRVCMQLGKVIQAQRKAIGLSQEELAHQANIDRTYISQIERGVGNPSLLIIAKVAKVLNVSLAQLFSHL